MLLIIFSCILFSCKKDKDDEEIPKPQPVDLVCTGSNSASYFPLAIENDWTFPAISVNTSTYHYTIYRTKVFNSLEYHEVTDSRGGYPSLYLRLDSSQNILSYDLSDSTEYLFIPSAPFAGQTWNSSHSATRTLTNLAASITTVSCTYDNCLVIQEQYSGGSQTTEYFYKKGFGPVRYNLSGFTFDLLHLILK